jgi:hypothetical protein
MEHKSEGDDSNNLEQKILFEKMINLTKNYIFQRLKITLLGLKEVREILIHKILYERSKAVREIVRSLKSKIF